MPRARTITIVTAAAIAVPAAAAFASADPAEEQAPVAPQEPAFTTSDARVAAAQARAAAYIAGLPPRTALAAARTVDRVGTASVARVARAKGRALAELYTPEWAKRWAKAYMAEHHGWRGSEYQALVALWQRESEWNFRSENPSSGAYGIPQSLPGSKMASVAPDWRTNPRTQIRWGLKYIQSTYGSPSAALAHSDAHNWY